MLIEKVFVDIAEQQQKMRIKMSNLKIGLTPVTNDIVIGAVLKNGFWGSNKTKVTNETLTVVADYLQKNGVVHLNQINDEGETELWELVYQKVKTTKKEC